MQFNSIIKINIDNKFIGVGGEVFIVAEAGVNHFGSMKKAKSLVDMAVDAGADAFKLQVYNTEKLVSRVSPDWINRLKPKELSWDNIKVIQDYCNKRGIIFFATAHEETSLDFLESINVPLYKIGSGEVGNSQFIEKVAQKGKPVILSTGMYTISEIRKALDAIMNTGNRNTILLHCITSYPTPPDEVNLRAMDLIKSEFNVPVGYSDHTEGWYVPLAAVARGACVIEKHITLDRNVPNAQDWKVSCGREDFKEFIEAVRCVEKSIGKYEKSPSTTEVENKKWARKSIVSRQSISLGTVITRDMLCTKRPGTGIPPERINEVIGRRSTKEIEEDVLIDWDQVE
jgi:N-acetylneuraminate synthase/N,N'-diacetyllegionaminate synthase